MTKVQEQVLEECNQKLGEHFEGFLLGVVWDDTQPDDKEQAEGKVIHWHGGWIQCVGLAEYAKHMLLERTVRKKLPPEEE